MIQRPPVPSWAPLSSARMAWLGEGQADHVEDGGLRVAVGGGDRRAVRLHVHHDVLAPVAQAGRGGGEDGVAGRVHRALDVDGGGHRSDHSRTIRVRREAPPRRLRRAGGPASQPPRRTARRPAACGSRAVTRSRRATAAGAAPLEQAAHGRRVLPPVDPAAPPIQTSMRSQRKASAATPIRAGQFSITPRSTSHDENTRTAAARRGGRGDRSSRRRSGGRAEGGGEAGGRAGGSRGAGEQGPRPARGGDGSRAPSDVAPRSTRETPARREKRAWARAAAVRRGGRRAQCETRGRGAGGRGRDRAGREPAPAGRTAGQGERPARAGSSTLMPT